MRNRIVLSAIGIGVVVLVFAFLFPKLADYGEVWEVLRDIPMHWILLVVVAAILNHGSYPFMMMALIPGLNYGRALAVRLASTSAANTIPGGGAIGVGITYVMLSEWKVPGARIASMVALTGIWNNILKLTLPLVALAIAVLQGGATGDLIEAALIGTAAVVVMLGAVLLLLGSPLRTVIEGFFDRLINRFRKRPDEGVVGRFFDSVKETSWDGWHRIALATVATNITLFYALLVSLRAAGVRPGEVHWSEALAAFAIIRLVSAIPITPGGVGVTELGLTGILGADLADPAVARIAAGVLLFRFVTFILPTPTGGIVALVWWRKRSRRRRTSGGVPQNVPPEHLETAVCYRCGLEGEVRWDLDPFALVECPRCGQAFMSPRLNEAGRSALYGRAEYFDDGVYGSDSASRLQRTWAKGRLDLIEGALGGRSEPSLYEVGCAYGLFLDAARRRGFQIRGLEYSPVAAERASDRLGVPIDIGEVTHLDRSEHHDAVAFWDVIEHTPDPKDFLEAAAAMVAPGGVIALSCPYFDSIAARVTGRKWWTLKPHKHIWHFTVPGLKQLLSETGLEVLKVVRNPLVSANFSRLDSIVVIARKPTNGD
jgi:uncharacterized membrane protein YbhN (UPF0104 family)/SAM-dependent methyltransferase